MASRAINIHTLLTRPARCPISPAYPPSPSVANRQHEARRILRSPGNIIPSAIQESSTATATDEQERQPPAATAAAPPAGWTAEKPKKAPVKDLLPLMEEDVIPALKASLEAQEDLSQIELSFHDNRLEGSFLKEGIPHIFWAFFPNGTLTGPKGFSLSSYASGASTVEPFLIDEKRITARHVIFWVEKRLAAQGIIPVWKEYVERKMVEDRPKEQEEIITAVLPWLNEGGG